jgi:hypothetical protein
MGRAGPLCPGTSDIHLLGNHKCIVQFDSKSAWTSHTYSPSQGWMLVSDDQIKDLGPNGPSRLGLSVKKLFVMGTQQMELAEDFVEIGPDRYQTILDSYTKNAASPNVECEFK